MEDVTALASIMDKCSLKQYTCFTELPNEILEKIALTLFKEDSNIDQMRAANKRSSSGRYNLARFSSTDKHIHEIATKILYKKINISTPVARKFLETVHINEKLAALVRDISLVFTFYETDEYEYGNNFAWRRYP